MQLGERVASGVRLDRKLGQVLPLEPPTKLELGIVLVSTLKGGGPQLALELGIVAGNEPPASGTAAPALAPPGTPPARPGAVSTGGRGRWRGDRNGGRERASGVGCRHGLPKAGALLGVAFAPALDGLVDIDAQAVALAVDLDPTVERH